MLIPWSLALCSGFACTEPGDDSSSDSGLPRDTADSTDTSAPASQCPSSMVPVGPPGEAPSFCIDPYEVTVTGDLGDADQHSEFAAPTTATTESLEGVQPAVLVSYGQALAACANTLAAPDVPEHGHKRLPTAAEWEDAADGLLGEGGHPWPYGDTWSDDACATPTADGTVVLSGTQATGSYPDCVSDFGVYDAVGNAWEWTDSGVLLDVGAWFDTASGLGVEVSLGPGDTLLAGPGATDQLLFRMQGLTQRVPEVDSDGTLFLPPEGFDDNALGIVFSGYLVLQEDGRDLATLPIWFDVPVRESNEEGPATTSDEPVHVLWEAEGATVPDKRGCAWYTGSDEGCKVTSGSLDHLHDFIGTITFRCVSDPIPPAP